MKPDQDWPFIVRLARAFGYAIAGVAAVSRDRMFRCQFIVGVAVVPVAAWLHVSRIEWSMLVLTIGLVLALEAMNSAIETCVDLAMPQAHPLAKRAKDIAAGAVLIASIAALVVGICLLGPKLWKALTV